MAGLVIGFLFLGALIGITVSAALVPLGLVSLPILGLMLRCADGLAAGERVRFDVLLGARIPGWPADPRRGYRWLVIPRRVTVFGRATGREIAYALLRLPVSLVTAVLSLMVWTMGVVLLTLPLYGGLLPGGGPRSTARC